MSLNLISSLSFLKSKLEKTEEVKMAEVTRPKVDMFAGMTESDLDTDSDSDSDSDSSQSSSPGFRTPDTENPPGPTQDILRRCLEMLNNDLTEAERVHRENLAKEKEAQKSKKVARAEEETKKEEEDVEKEERNRKSREPPQGLLKIASPSPGRRSRGSVDGSGSLQIALPESRSPSPGPPLLEPQQSLPSSPCKPPVSQISTPTKPSLPNLVASSTVQSTSLNTSTTIQSPLQKILLPPVPPGQAQQIVLQPQQAQNILQQASLQQNKVEQQPQTSLQPPMLIQNVLQQPQTMVQTPQSLIQQSPIMQTKILQQAQTITQQPQTLLQQPQNMLPQTQAILQQPGTIIQQNQSLLQPQQQQPTQGKVQVVQQAGLPLQFTSNPIPLLSHTGALLGTIGGVTNHPQLLSSLQQFTLLLQSNQQQQANNQMNFQPNLNNQIQIQPNMALANNNLQFQQVGCNQVQIQPNTMVTTTNNNQIQLQATGIAQNNNNNQIQVQPSVATSAFQMSTSVGGMVTNPSTQMQPTFTTQLQPNLNITGPTSQVKIKQEPGCPSVKPPTSIPTSNLLSTSQATSTTPQPLVASSTTNSLQLVQDPATGLYNLVPSVESSPKRSATPLSNIGSPLKLPKLLLPSLTSSSKENTPSPDPNDGKFMCGVCSKYFGNQKNLRVHISEIHEGKRGEFTCDLCNKVFPRKRNMERHKNAVHLKNSPTCYMCHKSVVNLDMHIRRFHRGSAEIKIKVEETAAAT